ncbi:MAG: hypothetical protein Q8Q42_02345 [Nanoarchaeota archaeon]|nr:hypothetical protein [Nanoarchaeota archaeon]
MNVQLEAFLFNEGEILESSASKRRNIETDEEETFEFTINIPEDNMEGTYNFLAKVLFAGKTETRMLQLFSSVGLSSNLHIFSPRIG